MKKVILVITFILVASAEVLSQLANYPYAAGGENGIFVLISGETSSYYRIERADIGAGDKIIIAAVNPAINADQFAERFSFYSAKFPDLLQPQVSELENIWNELQSHNNIDSLPYYGYSPVLRLALGIAYFDSSALPGKKYQYTVSKLDAASNITGSSVTNAAAYPMYLNADRPKSYTVKVTNDYAFLQFTIEENEQLSSFNIYRQTNGKGKYEKIYADKGFTIEDDNFILTIADRSVESGSFYKYFIVPTGLFGNSGDPSDTVFCGIYNFNSLSLPSGISVESIDSLNALRLSWSLDPMQPVISVKIFRSEHYDSVFNLLAEVSPEINEYFDAEIVPMKKYFYYLQLTGPMSELSPATARVFGFCQSNDVPTPPVNLLAEPLENGVKLSWQNSEEFIEGFRVYRSNGITDSLELISSLIKEAHPLTVYYDTINISGRYTYMYAIQSETTSHIASAFSDTVSVRPDIETFPPQPTNLTASLNEDIVLISWDDMSETDSTVTGYLVLRSEAETNEGSNQVSLTDSYLDFATNYFSDYTALPGKKYKYSVITLDMFGGISTSADVLFTPEGRKPLPPSGLMITSTSGEVELTWQKSADEKIAHYRVYRKSGTGTADFIGSVMAGDTPILSDEGTSKGELYHYFITSVSVDEIESERSEIVYIRP